MQKEDLRVIKIQTAQALNKWNCVCPHLHMTRKQLKLHTWFIHLSHWRFILHVYWDEVGKGTPGKTVYFLHCQLFFYWNVAPKPLSTAVHEISW